jgi:hypothetical protein
MKRDFSTMPTNPFSAKNWEADIHAVELEASCDDPLGYKAVFLLSREAAKAEQRKSFIIGASFLAKRVNNLTRAGFQAPMTRKAISLVENRLGRPLETA